MTTTEDNVQTNEPVEADAPTEAVAEVKNPTYLDLAKATWKLAYDLSPYGDRDTFCSAGINEYLDYFDLPKLVELDGNTELADKYIETWHAFKTWNATGADPADDQFFRNHLARAVRAKLQRDEPKPRDVMNGWLAELGLETFTPPRHEGRYNVSYTATTEVNSARMQEALRREFPNIDLRVTYTGRVA